MLTIRTFSRIDLTICEPKIAPNLQWDTEIQLYGSDHFPLIINNLTKHKTVPNITKKWKISHANWEIYAEELNKLQINLKEKNIDDTIAILTQKINEASEKAIPQTKTNRIRKHVPWWNNECKEAIKKHNQAFNKH